MAALGGNANDYNAGAMPAGIFEGCKETKGSTEVVKAPKPSTHSWVAIDIVGGANFMNGIVAIDGHDMWVYSMDGAYIEPQKVQALSVDNGGRYSVLVKVERAGRFKIRCHSASAVQTLIGNAILKVPGATAGDDESPRQWIDILGNPLSNDVSFFNQTVAYPFPPQPIAQKADETHILNMRFINNTYTWALNTTSLSPATLEQEIPPALFDPAATIAKHDNVTIVTKYGTWIDLVLFASVLNMPAHPIHKHGVKMFVLGRGTGSFRWKSAEDAIKEVPESFNLVNPPRRDTVPSTPTAQNVGWVVVRYQVTNAGAWVCHCHIANHMMGGMVMVILDGTDAWPTIPAEYNLT
ncbi:hypothetical protein EsDP_00003087 [Epichloe bromicola]|uniref:Multicopper oxidase n=1 Tax=Epichloe bromicola TaxID=79588 RepID=A0ABQ0CMQ0_9HYPO